VNPGERFYKTASCRIAIALGLPEEMHEGTREVVGISSDNPRKGHATALMHQVCAEADVDGIVLILMPKPFGNGMTSEQLEKWYGRLGFVTVQELPEKLMVRQPRIDRAPRLVHSWH
jgi:hypothetical protein